MTNTEIAGAYLDAFAARDHERIHAIDELCTGLFPTRSTPPARAAAAQATTR